MTEIEISADMDIVDIVCDWKNQASKEMKNVRNESDKAFWLGERIAYQKVLPLIIRLEQRICFLESLNEVKREE